MLDGVVSLPSLRVTLNTNQCTYVTGMVKGHGEQYPQSNAAPCNIPCPDTRCNRFGKRSQLAISTSQLQHPVATHLIAGKVQVLQQRVLLQSLPQAL